MRLMQSVASHCLETKLSFAVTRNLSFKTGVALAALLGASGTAWAQSTSNSDESEPSATVNEIVVTAQRREQNLQDVGIAITAISGENIEKLNLSSSSDLARSVPNLSIGEPSGAGSQPAIFMRGIGLSDFATNNAGPIGVYIDDIYISSPSAQIFQLFDLDRVEVLRGPQGTLYGRNTTGGAIRFISARPGDEFEARLRTQYSSFETTKFEGMIAGPISDNVGIRLAAVKDDSEGFSRNLFDGSRRNGQDSLAFRGLLDAEFGDRITAQLSFHAGIVDGPAASYRLQGLMEADGVTPCASADVRANRCFDFFGFSAPDDWRTVNENREPTLDVDSYIGSFRLGWEGDNVTLVSITGFQTLDKLHQEENDMNPLSWLAVDYGVESDSFTQEIQASGNFGRHEWIAGLFYLNETLDQLQIADLGREFRPVVESVDPVSFPGGFDPVGAAIGLPVFSYNTANRQKTKSFAAYAQNQFAVTDRLNLIAGLRYTNEKKSFVQQAVFIEPDFTVPLFDFTDSMTDNNLSWKLGAEYHASDDVLIYGSATTGFKAGGYNGGFLFDASEQNPYDPEKILAFELGFKSTLWDGLARFNATAFLNKYSDMQLYRFETFGGLIPTSILDNAGKADTMGVEAELTLAPARGLDIQLAVGFLDTELVEYQSDAGPDLTGNRLIQSPKFSFNGAIDYAVPLGNAGELLLHTDFGYKSMTFFTADNDPNLSQPGYWLANGRVAFRGGDGLWEIAIFANNLFDKEYLQYGFPLGDLQGSNQLMIGRPRSIGGEISFRF